MGPFFRVGSKQDRLHALRASCVIAASVLAMGCSKEAPPTGVGADFRKSEVTSGMTDFIIAEIDPMTSTGRGINNRGEVVGSYNTGVPSTTGTAYRWSERQSLEFLPGTSAFQFSEPNAINNRGDIVGVGCPTVGSPCRALVWMASGSLIQLTDAAVLHAINNRGVAVGAANGAIIWTARRGVRRLVGGSVAIAINERGDIVGGALGQAALWPRGGPLVTLPTPLGEEAWATGINNAGEVVGFIGPHFTSHGFLWSERDGLRLLETPDGWYSHPEAINERGDVVGWLRSADDSTLPGTQRAVLWTAGRDLVELPSLAAGRNSVAMDLNDQREIVGSSAREDPQTSIAVIWIPARRYGRS